MTSQAFTTKKKKQKRTGLSKIAATKLSFKSPNCSKKFLKKMIDIGMWIGMWKGMWYVGSG